MFTRPIATGGAWTPPIEQSLIFDGAAELNRTSGTVDSTTTRTICLWVRFSEFGVLHRLFGYGNNVLLWRAAGNTLNISTSSTILRTTNAAFRDTGWYHIAVVINTTEATASDRIKMYVNGLPQTYSTSVDYSLNQAVFANSQAVSLGDWDSNFFEGAMADFHEFDGVALTESQINSIFLDGVTFDGQTLPAPKAVTGVTYGGDGSHLAFADTANFGDDTSGNGNDWTPTGFVAGDQTADVPGRPYGRWSGIDKGASITISDGGRGLASSGTSSTRAIFPLTVPTYWEINVTTSSAGARYGIANQNMNVLTTAVGDGTNNTSYGYLQSGTFASNAAVVATYSSFTSGDRLNFAFDPATGKFWIGKNGVWQNSGDPAAGTGQVATVTMTNRDWFPAVGCDGSTGYAASVNFGDGGYTDTPPPGFLPLHTGNLPTPTADGRNWFAANIRTGTGAAYNVTTGPANGTDLVWAKGRSGATDHALYDIVRGVQQQLESNTTTAETTEATGLTAFNSTGYTAGALAQMNTSAATYVDWMWKANGAGVANTDGTISSTVSVAAAGHFSIVGYTGTGANATVGHGLPGAPECIIIKNRDQADAWAVYHSGVAADAETDYLVLNTTAAAVDDATYWQDTAPTSSVFSIGTAVVVNTNTEDYIAYCFRSIPGLCKVGSYTGNGSADGPLIDLGFKARWLLVKAVDFASQPWVLIDTARDPDNNGSTQQLLANAPDVEATSTANYIEILSTQFKCRGTDSATNRSGTTYIYLALAELAGGGDLPWPLAA